MNKDGLKIMEDYLVSQIRILTITDWRSREEQEILNRLSAELKFLREDPDGYIKYLQSREEERKQESKESILPDCLKNPQFEHVSGRLYAVNDSCFLWMLIIWGICLLIGLPFFL